jgi:acyl-coenzyme A thioesterase PaaI-like protein
MDLATVVAGMPTFVPMVGTLNLEFVELSSGRALLRLPDQAEYHNHIGGPHAGAMFTLAESATGALILGNFGFLIEEATPLAVEGSIRYRKVAMGPVLADAVMDRPVAEIVAEVRAGQRPVFNVEVELRTEDGTVTGLATFVWTLRPNRKP